MMNSLNKWAAVLFVILSLCLPSYSHARCGGTERWPIKMGTDQSAASIDISSPESISIKALNQITDPRSKINKKDNDTRLDLEKKVYKVDGFLRLFKNEADQDYHLVITDQSLKYSKGGSSSKGKETGTSFIAEIADPKCYMGNKGSITKKSHWATQLREARDQFELRFPGGEGADELVSIPVTLTGVAFFDRDHGQVGRAKNGFELHPVLSITFNDEIQTFTSDPTNLIKNSGFEEGAVGWISSPGVIEIDGYPDAARGDAKAVLGNLGKSGQTFLYQQVSIPASATKVTLTFRLRVRTGEPASSDKEFDTLRLQIRDEQGNWLKTKRIYSNADKSRRYKRQSFDLTEFKGKTIRLHFVSKENSSNATSFNVDDVALRAN